MEWVFYTRTPYLFECGVLHRLSDSRFCQNLFVDKRNNLTLSFCTNPSFGVGGTAINIMDNLEQNIADFISTVPKGCIFDAHSVISYLLKNHSDDYFDFHNDAEATNSFHTRVSRAINPFVDKNIIERIDAKSYSLNIRGNFSENSCWKKL